MSLFPPEFLEITQVLSGLLIILTFPALIVAYYWWLPKVGQKIGTQLAMNFLRGLMQILKSNKMSELGQKGVAAREFEAMIATPSGDDPVKEILSPIAAGFVAERYGKKASGAVEMAISALPVNLTSVLLPKVADWADAKWPQLKLAEQLRAFKVIQGAEPVK